MRTYESGARRGAWRTLGAILFTLLLVVVVVAIFGFTQGWLSIDSREQTTTIEVDRSRLREAADDATAASQKAMRETGEALEQIGEKMQTSTNPDDEDHDAIKR